MRELWLELGTTMRMLREKTDLSLRQVEAETGTGRGTLSQVERGRSRPSRELVEWYDTHVGGDGLLVAIFAEARGAHRAAARPDEVVHHADGDECEVRDPLLPCGAMVPAGRPLTVGWTLANVGAQAWTGRSLRRVGAHAAPRLIASPPLVPVPDCGPGETVPVHFEIGTPELPGTLAAYWQMVDGIGRVCLPAPAVTSVLLVVR